MYGHTDHLLQKYWALSLLLHLIYKGRVIVEMKKTWYIYDSLPRAAYFIVSITMRVINVWMQKRRDISKTLRLL